MSKVRICTSTIADGNMSYRWGAEHAVFEARNAFVSKHNFGTAYIEMSVEHSNNIIDVSGQTDFSRKPSCDALVTATAIPLFLLTADCLPIVVHDPLKNVMSLLHVGWRSAHERLPELVIAYLQSQYGSSVLDLEIYFGPGIAASSYIVPNPEQASDERWGQFVTKTQDGFSVDVAGYAHAQCIASGVRSENITLSSIDTCTSTQYFSHYRASRTGEQEGRIATIAQLVI
jgi:copper oxidase (laccase) domain-containing protein